jgi:nicotinamidase-related amidase
MGSALIVIDVQNEYFTGAMPIVYPDREGSLAKIVEAMRAATAAGSPVIVVQHHETDPESPVFRPGSDGAELHSAIAAEPRDHLVLKHLPGSFTGTNLGDILADRSVDHLVVCGYMTHMCCDTTTRQAAHRGMRVSVLADAMGDVDLVGADGVTVPARQVHETELAVLGDGFATVTTVDAWVAGGA